MPMARQIKSWDVDRGHPTPEFVFLNRRDFVKQATAATLGWSAAIPASASLAFGANDRTLKDTLTPPTGSAFVAGKRNAEFVVRRPVTDELTAAKYNNFYEFGVTKDIWRAAQKLTTHPWQIEITGLVAKPLTIDIDELIRKMPCEERLYRFRCVERWAMVVPWSGFPLKALLALVQPLSSAKFVAFFSFNRPTEAPQQRSGSGYTWPYYEGLTIAEATNELAFVATGLYGHDLPKQHGAPIRMVVPWKYGYKGPKSVMRMVVTDKRPHTFWNDLQPKEYGFYSNINPAKPHPRWSQKIETMLGSNEPHDTLLYNGYGRYVAKLYKGDEH